MANPLGGNGPRPGRTTGRQRNSLVNNASKKRFPGTNYPQGYQAPVSSAGAVQYGDQLAGARYEYLSQLAALKAQRPLIGQAFGVAVTDARQSAIQGMAAQEGNAMDRGVLNSSADLGARADVIAARQRAIAEAQATRATAKLELGNQAIGIRGDYYTQLGSIQNAMSQEQMYNTTQAFQQDQFDALNQNYQQVLQALRDQKSGRAPRHRRGHRSPEAGTRTSWSAQQGGSRPGGFAFYA